MIRKMFVIGCLCFFCMNLFAAEQSGNATTAADEASFALLVSLVSSLGEMARAGKVSYEEVNTLLQKKMAELKKARAEKQIDPVFYKRYKRILVVLKLTILDTSYDPEGILDSLISNELKAFIVDVTGADEQLPPPEHRGIGTVAGALFEEILNLYIYLDGKKDREKLREKYFKR